MNSPTARHPATANCSTCGNEGGGQGTPDVRRRGGQAELARQLGRDAGCEPAWQICCLARQLGTGRCFTVYPIHPPLQTSLSPPGCPALLYLWINSKPIPTVTHLFKRLYRHPVVLLQQHHSVVKVGVDGNCHIGAAARVLQATVRPGAQLTGPVQLLLEVRGCMAIAATGPLPPQP